MPLSRSHLLALLRAPAYGSPALVVVNAADNPGLYIAKPIDSTILVDLTGYPGPGPDIFLTTPLDDFPILVRSLVGSGSLHPWTVAAAIAGLLIEDPVNPGTFLPEVTFATDFGGASWTFDRVRTRWILADARGSPSANERAIALPFTFATPSPLVLSAIPAGAIVSRSILRIDTAFDGAGAALSLGTPFSPARLLAPGDSAPGVVGQYESEDLVSFAALDALQLQIVPGAGATAGAGLVFVNLRS